MRGNGKLFLLGLAAGLALFALLGAATLTAEKTSFERLKSLRGDWRKLAADGTLAPDVNNTFRSTAAGTALLETVFPGTGHEMVTLYYERDGELVLTHYCVEGNQPAMRLIRAEKNELRFECGGEDPHFEEERHMHRAEFTFIDSDHIRTRWYLYEKGKNLYTAESDLVRSAD